MENWNKNEWQGRRKDQYESSALFTILGASAIALSFIGYIISNLFI